MAASVARELRAHGRQAAMRTNLVIACIMATLMGAMTARADVTTLSCIVSGTLKKNDKIESISKAETLVRIVIGDDIINLHPQLPKNYPKTKFEKMIEFYSTFTQGMTFLDGLRDETTSVGNWKHIITFNDNYFKASLTFISTSKKDTTMSSIMIDRNSGLIEYSRWFNTSDIDINYYYSEEDKLIGNCSIDKNTTKKF